MVNFLGTILDIRNVKIETFWVETDEEKERPYFWKYWMKLPKRGQIGIFFGAWYTKLMNDYIKGDVNEVEFQYKLTRIVNFEKMLADDGAVIVKLWVHFSKDEQMKKLKKLSKEKKLTDEAKKRAFWNYENYKKIIDCAEKTIRFTDRAESRWYLIEAKDKQFRELKAVQIIYEHLKNLNLVLAKEQINIPVKHFPNPILEKLDLNKSVKESTYNKKMDEYRERINELMWKAYRNKISTILVFEGWDAAGKGGAIRRLASAMDIRLLRVMSVSAPNEEERSYHYLWRFWKYIPMYGFTTIFDRSWYGRVLVECVEKFATYQEIERSYEEIVDFENNLVSSNVVVIKFWLHIDKEEQLKRFKEREQTEWKNYKITEEDWRNREKWDKYMMAANDMIFRTSSKDCPWFISGS
ncbi:MAG: AMP-polyphosphate phosphotransferase [Deferribacteres bacterium]|nr:AMP-polyphosphate phosphotransferase [Deferribacteres bacterium]